MKRSQVTIKAISLNTVEIHANLEYAGNKVLMLIAKGLLTSPFVIVR